MHINPLPVIRCRSVPFVNVIKIFTCYFWPSKRFGRNSDTAFVTRWQWEIQRFCRQNFQLRHGKNCVCVYIHLRSANCLVYLHFRYKCFKLPGATPAEDVAVWFVCWMNWVNVSGHVPISHADLQQRESALSILFWVHPNRSSQWLLRPAAIYLLPSSSTSSSVQGTPCSFAFQDKLRRSLSLCATLAPFLRAQVHTVQGLGPRLGFQLCWAQSVVAIDCSPNSYWGDELRLWPGTCPFFSGLVGLFPRSYSFMDVCSPTVKTV